MSDGDNEVLYRYESATVLQTWGDTCELDDAGIIQPTTILLPS